MYGQAQLALQTIERGLEHKDEPVVEQASDTKTG